MGRETDGRAAKSAYIRLVYRFRARLSSGRKLRGRRAISLKRDASCVILNRNDKCNRRAGAKAPDVRGITGERETVMRKKRGWRRAAALALSAVLLAGTALALYDAIWPQQSGTDVLTSKSLVVDAGNAAQGYILAHGKENKKRLKLRVTQGQYKLTYDLNTAGEYEVFPLQLGDGSYTVELFENVSGKKYAAEGKVTVSVKLDDPYAPFLGPNQYVHYTQDTEAVKTSYALCEGMTDDREIFETIRGYIKANYMYDYVKAATVAGGTLPDIDGCYEKKMGICQDLAALAACMLRVQGVPTKLMVGYAGKMYHAWNSVVIDGEEVLYDPTLELSAIESGQTYTTERYY